MNNSQLYLLISNILLGLSFVADDKTSRIALLFFGGMWLVGSAVCIFMEWKYNET